MDQYLDIHIPRSFLEIEEPSALPPRSAPWITKLGWWGLAWAIAGALIIWVNEIYDTPLPASAVFVPLAAGLCFLWDLSGGF